MAGLNICSVNALLSSDASKVVSVMKIVIIGAVLAGWAGSYAGSAMRPELAVWRGPMAPAPVGAMSFDDSEPAGIWPGPGPAPDYVVGVGWPAEPSADDIAPVEAPPLDYPDPVWTRRDTFTAVPEDEPWPPAAFPSEGGDILAGVRGPE